LQTTYALIKTKREHVIWG